MRATIAERRRIPAGRGLVRAALAWGALAWSGTAAAGAACGGTDLLAALEKSDKAAHEALFDDAHAVPNGQGLFWQVTSADAPRSYVFATYSDPELGAEPLADAVAGALASARVVMIPMSEAEQKRMDESMASDPAIAIDPNRSGLMAGLTAEERATAEKLLEARGLPARIVEQLRPPILYAILAVPPCVSEQIEKGGRTVEDRVVAAALEAGVPVKGLETYERALGSVAAVPVIDRILLVGLRELPRVEDNHRTEVELYKDGETAAIWAFRTRVAERSVGAAPGQEAMDQLETVMLGTRNQHWAEVLAPELKKGGVFVAVDALHLPGPEGLIAKLRGMEFRVERLDG